MEKNKFKDKLTVKNISKTFGAIIFVLVFVFTFLVTSNELRQHWVILLAVFGSLVLAAGIVWLVMALVVKHKKDKTDTNKQTIKKALDKLEEEAKKEKNK